MNQNMIELSQVTKTFQTKAGKFNALKNVSLSVNQGEFISIIGKSGSGKSTLLNMITGIDRPTQGKVIVADAPIHTYKENKMAIWRGRNIGIVFQFFQLLPNLTILENTIIPMDFCKFLAFPQRKKRAIELLDLVGLADHAHKYPGALSGGEQQRAAIARAMANDPQLIIADEPTGNLDTITATQIMKIFYRLNNEGKTILMVTHDRNITQNQNRVILLEDGKITLSNKEAAYV